MAAQRGKDLLLKLDDGAGQFVAVAGLRARQITFNAEAVDVTHAGSVGRWRELLAGAAVRRAAVSGSGVFRDEMSDAMVRQALFDDVIRGWQICIPDSGIVQGPFHIASLDYRGSHDGEVTFDLSLQSAGALTFTPV